MFEQKIIILQSENGTIQVDTPEGPYTRDLQGKWHKQNLSDLEGMDFDVLEDKGKVHEIINSLLSSGIDIHVSAVMLLHKLI
jgi:hypothetical protein